MRRQMLSDKLAPFEVYPERQLHAGSPLIARLLGRRFDEMLDGGVYDRPFDARFGKAMLKTLSHVAARLGASFGYAERTELSLFAVAGGGDARRLLSRLAGESSAKLSIVLGEVATFESRLYEFPNVELALEYFHWRQGDTVQSTIDRYCYHVLTQSGADQAAVPRILDGLGADEKVELLRQNALDFSQVPAWQRLGACVRVQPHAENGHAGKLLVDLNLPPEDGFGAYLRHALLPSG